MINVSKAITSSIIAMLTGNFRLADKTGIVIVGMQHSKRYGACEGASLDAGRMLGVLSKYGKPVVLQDRQATKAAVTTALQNAVQNNDLTIFFYSGHGGSDPIGDVSNETDGRNEYLCLYDTYMLDNEIWSIVSQSKGRVFMIFDCCHSETMFRSPVIRFDDITDEQNLRIQYGLEPRGKKNNVLVWSGCPDSSFSYGDNKTGGVLTSAIISTLKKFPKIATYNQIWSAMTKVVNLKQQMPKRTIIGKGFGGPVFR